jgi:transcriptional regulator with PAS, ATPase and Fis domain
LAGDAMKTNIDSYTNNKLPVLILGETGSGKSYLAKKIHNSSINSNLRYIQINMAAISENLFESELFGHTKGAFTGALTNKVGFCDEVGSGTLFLDEIGDLNLTLQAKLLMLLDEKIYYPVGSVQKKIFNGRVIVATNKNILKMVKEGAFREDLYYRLRLLEARLPALRESADIRAVIWKEIQNYKVKNNSYEIIVSTDALELMCNYKWPGNYRELINTIELLFSLTKARINIEDLPSWIRNIESITKCGMYHDALSNFEKDYLKKALIKYSGRINHTAEKIGLNKVTLISKLKKHGIDRRQYKHLESIKRTYGF